MSTEPPAPPEWELVSQRGDWDTTERLLVDGGWLYRSILTPHGASMQPLVMTMSFAADVAAVDPGPPDDQATDKLK